MDKKGKIDFHFTFSLSTLEILSEPSPFPSPFPLRPLTPSRFPIWESSWAHRDSRRGSQYGSHFRSSPYSYLSFRLWFPLPETTFQGLEALILLHFEAV